MKKQHIDGINYEINDKYFNVNGNDYLLIVSNGRIHQSIIDEMNEKIKENTDLIKEVFGNNSSYNQKELEEDTKLFKDSLLTDQWINDIIRTTKREHGEKVLKRIEALEFNCNQSSKSAIQKTNFYKTQRKKLYKKLNPEIEMQLTYESIFTYHLLKNTIESDKYFEACFNNYNIPSKKIYDRLTAMKVVKEQLKQLSYLESVKFINSKLKEIENEEKISKEYQPKSVKETTTKQQMLILHYLGFLNLINEKTTLPNTEKAQLISKILNRNDKNINDCLTYLHATKPERRHNLKTEKNLSLVKKHFDDLELNEYSELVQKDINRLQKE